MARKKKEVVYLIDCPNCDSFDAETWELVQAHINLVHATVYEKAGRGDYTPKLPYASGRDEASRAVQRAYQEEQRRLVEQFQRDLEAEHGVVDNSKKEKLFDIAWSQGHSSGFSEVALHYDELVELIK
jgi:hypothetical protein